MIRPLSFDHETAREMTGDGQARTLEAKARADADAGTFDYRSAGLGGTYWAQVQESMHLKVYLEQFNKRKARNERKAAR